MRSPGPAAGKPAGCRDTPAPGTDRCSTWAPCPGAPSGTAARIFGSAAAATTRQPSGSDRCSTPGAGGSQGRASRTARRPSPVAPDAAARRLARHTARPSASAPPPAPAYAAALPWSIDPSTSRAPVPHPTHRGVRTPGRTPRASPAPAGSSPGPAASAPGIPARAHPAIPPAVRSPGSASQPAAHQRSTGAAATAVPPFPGATAAGIGQSRSAAVGRSPPFSAGRRTAGIG